MELTMEFETVEDNIHYDGVKDINVLEVSKKLSELFLVDVRQPEEFTGDLGHIPGAQLIVLDTLEDNFDKIPKDKTPETLSLEDCLGIIAAVKASGSDKKPKRRFNKNTSKQ